MAMPIGMGANGLIRQFYLKTVLIKRKPKKMKNHMVAIAGVVF